MTEERWETVLEILILAALLALCIEIAVHWYMATEPAEQWP